MIVLLLPYKQREQLEKLSKVIIDNCLRIWTKIISNAHNRLFVV